MSLNAIEDIMAAEEAAKNARATARKKADTDIANAEAAGQEALHSARKKAETRCAELMKEAEIRASDSAANLFENTANKCAIMRAHAESRFDEAAAFIAGRIVKS